jgi:hypothetical protein
MTTNGRDPRERAARAELQRWYLESLRPKLARAAAERTVAPGALDLLDRKLCDFLELTVERKRRAA